MIGIVLMGGIIVCSVVDIVSDVLYKIRKEREESERWKHLFEITKLN